jgi:rare lipoprotein A
LLPRLPGSDGSYRAPLLPALARLLILLVGWALARAARQRRGLLAVLLVLTLLRVAGCAGGPRPTPPERPDDTPRIGFEQRGVASWYGPGFHGRRTANGEVYDMEAMTAAHRTLIFGSLVEVHNLDNNRRTRVRINDRGPFIHGRIIDLSRAAARDLEMIGPGIARVRIRVVDCCLGLERTARRAAGEQAPATGSTWWVQAGAFLDRARARELADRLSRRYPDVRVSPSGSWHRVLLGPYDLRRAADDVAQALLDAGYDVILRPAER